ncbi:copper homeostasis periplasmic binding protein CopC [Tardiphaga sp.]|uniref:copper homeostasis periplasmic binding protein CopC n=1 Tax=Tardiphaga sp. TaxID=1926292 RepID=UPI00352B6514
MRPLNVSIAAIALIASAGVAQAHPKLVSANPAANTAVAAPGKISLTFSEKLVPAFSKAELTMSAMPGMAAMQMASSAAVAPDGRTLIITPKSRLARGKYVVTWHVVSGDTHKIAGNYTFAVK